MARQMKDSGVEWIGEIPEEWECRRLKDFFVIISGSGFKPEHQGNTTENYPVYKAGDISMANGELTARNNTLSQSDVERLGFQIIPKGSIIFPKIGEAMRKNSRAINSCDCCLDNNCEALIPNNINTAFSYYTLLCYDMSAFDNGGTIPSINNKKLLDSKFALPSFFEQERVACILDTKCAEIDKVVEQTRATIEEYKKLKQAIITEAVTKGVRGPRPMKPSGVEWIGEIPEEWEIKRIKYEVAMRNEKGVYCPEKHKYIGLENIQGFSNTLVDTASTYEEAEYQVCQKGDVMYSRLRPNLCKAVICPIDGFCTGELMLFAYFTGDNNFLRYWLLSDPVTTVIVQSTYGTKMPRANPSYILNLPICLPKTTEQQEIAAYLDTKCAEIDRIIEKKEQLIEELGSYKKSLIYEYVTGKKEVKTNMELKVPYSN